MASAAILTRFPGMRRVRVRACAQVGLLPSLWRRAPSDFLHSPDGGPGPVPEASGVPATETVWRTRREQEIRKIHRRVLLLATLLTRAPLQSGEKEFVRDSEFVPSCFLAGNST